MSTKLSAKWFLALLLPLLAACGDQVSSQAPLVENKVSQEVVDKLVASPIRYERKDRAGMVKLRFLRDGTLIAYNETFKRTTPGTWRVNPDGTVIQDFGGNDVFRARFSWDSDGIITINWINLSGVVTAVTKAINTS